MGCHFEPHKRNESFEQWLYRLEDVIYRQRKRPNEELLEQILCTECAKEPTLAHTIQFYKSLHNHLGGQRTYLGLLSMIQTEIETRRREKNAPFRGNPMAMTVTRSDGSTSLPCGISDGTTATGNVAYPTYDSMIAAMQNDQDYDP